MVKPNAPGALRAAENVVTFEKPFVSSAVKHYL
jgi:hypothetical protein